jgi:hypothetical protein
MNSEAGRIVRRRAAIDKEVRAMWRESGSGRALARPLLRRSRAIAAPWLLALLAACGSGESVATAPDATASPKKTLEPVELRRVLLPPDIFGMSESAFAMDNHHLVVGFVSRTGDTRPPGQLGLVDPDSGALRCLTCGLPIPGVDEAERPTLGKPQPVSDGKRVLFRSGERPDSDSDTPLALFTGDAGFFRYYLLECEPSVVQCDQGRIMPIRLPSEGLGALTQNREARISPDPNWFAWTEVKSDGTRMALGRLKREAEQYVLEDIWVINPKFDLARGSSDDWRVAMPLYEFKNFAEGGRIAYYASFHDAQNYDVFRVDLATGERKRVTHDIEWNEGTVTSPDGSSFVNGSSRGRARMASYAQVPRPPFADFGVYVLTGRHALGGNNRRCLLEPWLLDADGQSGEYFGQPVNPDNDPGWGSHGPGSWSMDGIRYTFWERNYADAPEVESRIAVAMLPARAASPAPQVPLTPRPTWATPHGEWKGALNKVGVFLVRGKHSGTALLTLTGVNPNTTGASVVYVNYSDDGEHVLNGSENSINPFTLMQGNWITNLRVSGKHSGSLETQVFSLQKELNGRVQSTLDGVSYNGIPDAQCEPESLPAPQLRITREPDARGRAVLRITARPISDDSDRPVRGVRVSDGGTTVLSDDSGIARLPLPHGPVDISAEAGGFRGVVQRF